MTSDYCSGHERCYCCYNWESRYCRVIVFKHFIRNSRYWSPRLATSRWLCLSVCPHVCHKHCSFFFVSRWNRAIFGPSVHHDPIHKTLFFHFWFRPPNAQHLLPQICTKSSIIRLVRQIDRKCLGLSGGFRGWPIQWNHTKCCGSTLVAMATKFGLGEEIQSPTGLSFFIRVFVFFCSCCNY